MILNARTEIAEDLRLLGYTFVVPPFFSLDPGHSAPKGQSTEYMISSERFEEAEVLICQATPLSYLHSSPLIQDIVHQKVSRLNI